MKRRVRILFTTVVLMALAATFGAWHFRAALLRTGAMNTVRATAPSGPRTWAEPAALPGVPNLHKVSDDLYRGAQPTAEGMRALQKRGIRTIVNLRTLHSDRDEIGATPLDYVHIPMTTWRPVNKNTVRFLQLVTDPNRTPVFVHCLRGADRTGTMCAVYRVAVQGWSKDEALDEMTRGGFQFYEGWTDLVDYVRNLDANDIRRAAGLDAN